MSKLLRDLLDAQEPLFTQSLRQLEVVTGKKAIDVQLIAELLEKTHRATQELGLDSQDTTGKELFHGLAQRVREDNQRLAKKLGTSEDAPVNEILPRLVAAVKESDVSRRCWVLKRSVAKELLRAAPPKNMMKHLGYRSLESMLKNENINEIYTGLRFSEDSTWLHRYGDLFEKRILPSDFETRDIEICIMDQDKWVDLATNFVRERQHTVVHSKELGVIALTPVHATHKKGLPLLVIPLIFQYMNEIRSYSAFFKLKSTGSDFGQTVSKTLITDTDTGLKIAGQDIHWRVIQRHFGTHKKTLPEAFEPHVQLEDLFWHKAETALHKMDNTLAYWKDMEYTAVLGEDGLPVTFNLMDVAKSYSNQSDFTKRSYIHFRNSLWNEIFSRYIGEDKLQQQILQHLESGSINPEEIN